MFTNNQIQDELFICHHEKENKYKILVEKSQRKRTICKMRE
jgi:hypothetical protein